MSYPRVLAVVPAHNEGQTIAQVILELRRSAPYFDRLVVNDGSQDETGEILDQLGEAQLRLPYNMGYSSALQLGLKYMLKKNYDVVVFLDADGQHRPEDVPRLVDALLVCGADMVIGSRYCEGGLRGGSRGRRLGQALLSRFTSLVVGRRIYDTTSGFKALRATACRALVEGTFMDLHAEAIVRLSMQGFDIEEIPIEVHERRHGESMYSLTSVARYPLNTLMLTLLAAIDSIITRRAG